MMYTNNVNYKQLKPIKADLSQLSGVKIAQEILQRSSLSLFALDGSELQPADTTHHNKCLSSYSAERRSFFISLTFFLKVGYTDITKG